MAFAFIIVFPGGAISIRQKLWSFRLHVALQIVGMVSCGLGTMVAIFYLMKKPLAVSDTGLPLGRIHGR